MNGYSSQRAWQRMIPLAESSPRRLKCGESFHNDVTTDRYTDRYHFFSSIEAFITQDNWMARPHP